MSKENKIAYYYESSETTPLKFVGFDFMRKEREYDDLPYMIWYTASNPAWGFENFKHLCRMAVIEGAEITAVGFGTDEQDEAWMDFSKETWSETWEMPQDGNFDHDTQVILVSDGNLRVHFFPKGTKYNVYQKHMINTTLSENEKETAGRSLFLRVMHNLLTEERQIKLNKRINCLTIVISDI
jgi:hypothetical protein